MSDPEFKKGGLKMPFLARGIMIFKRGNKFKLHVFQNKEKAQRFWLKCKRRGLDAQLVY